VLPKAILENTLNTLKKFAAFSKVKIENITNDLEISSYSVFKNIGNFDNENSWQLFNIEKGIPTIYSQTIEMFTPHMLNLPELGAVSFDKGCYLGQEIIARTEYLGKSKRQMCRAIIETNEIPLPGNKLVNHDNEDVGNVVSAALTVEKKFLMLAVVVDDFSEGVITGIKLHRELKENR
jgi:folate-binding protein YgfZ